MPVNLLAEVFGCPVGNRSDKAERHQAQKPCPFNNKVPNCTKDKAENPPDAPILTDVVAS